LRIFDISLTITPDTPRYPGKVQPRRDILMDMAEGAVANCSAVYLDCHVGTHVDAPRHFVRDGITIEDVSVERFCGPCRVVEIQGRRDIRPEDLADVPRGVRVLFKTVGSSLLHAGQDDPNGFAYLTPAVARRLVELETQLVGIDGFSIDEYGSTEPSHHIILPAGISILECIDLTDVPPSDYELTVLPLKIAGAEAAPARAILRRLR
jgi:arylformamidase